jgi:hypothetical protein
MSSNRSRRRKSTTRAQESDAYRAKSASTRVVARDDSRGNHDTMIRARAVIAGLTAGLLAAGCGGRTEADEAPGCREKSSTLRSF